MSYSMAPYAGPWTFQTAAHLLRRTMFGATHAQITNAVSNGMNSTVTSLLQIPAVGEPLAWDPAETIVAPGNSWVTAVYPSDPVAAQNVETARSMSMGAWMLERLNDQSITVAEKMCLFWQNHFACTAISDSRGTYNYAMKIRQHALGNVKQMVKDITLEPTMLLFLNGATNNVFYPNENYAREFLELFTIGKGTQIGPGDYTNYTEQDVAAGAKIFTGYYVDGLRSDTLSSPVAIYNGILHDTSTKQLSAHFGNQTVANADANEYANYIDIVFQQDAVAQFICTKLYRYFVNYDITADVQTNVIDQMAQTMITNNYDLLPVLDELFKSDHFYSTALLGSMIKSPLDMMFSMLNVTSSAPTFSPASNGDIYMQLYWLADNMGEAYATPPSVSGWPAYYQVPMFTKLWVNATHIKTRFAVGAYLTLLSGIQSGADSFKINALGYLDNLTNPYDANVVINDMCDSFFSKPIDPLMKLVLKGILTNGQTDDEWTVQYQQYQNNIGNPTYEEPIKLRVRTTLARMFQMPEFQVM